MTADAAKNRQECRLPSDPMVRVIVVNFNGGDHLAECLRGLSLQTFRAFEVVVFDNASTDDSIESARIDDPRFRYVLHPENLGFAEANNRAANGAGTPWIATLNPDAVPDANWLRNLIQAVRRSPDATMFGSTLIDAKSTDRFDGAGDCLCVFGIPWRGNRGRLVSVPLEEGEVFSPCAAAALYRTDVFHAVGGFDSAFFCYCEDVDLAFRIRMSGGRCIQVPDALVWHIGSASTGKTNGFSTYYGTRNRIWLFYKNMPSVLFWGALPLMPFIHVAFALRGLAAGQGKHCLRGTWEGYRAVPSFLKMRILAKPASGISWRRIATSLTWNPISVFRRTVRARPVTGYVVRSIPYSHRKWATDGEGPE